MTDAAVKLDSYGHRRLQPLRALRAFRKLVRDKEDTAQVFEIMQALSGRSIPRGFRRLADTPDGGRMIYERLELAEKFGDPSWLDSFAPGTVGAVYREFIRSEGLSAEGLAAQSRKVEPLIDVRNAYAWYGRRLRDVHDVWHVLTGYGRDALGEACVVSFSYAQTGSLGFAFIGLGGASEIQKERPDVPARRAVFEAWRNGRAAAWLPGLDYEALFAENLDAARERLNIRPPRIYQSVKAEVRANLKLRMGAEPAAA